MRAQGMGPKQCAQPGELLGAVEARVLVDEIGQGLLWALDAEPVAPFGGCDHRADQPGIVSERSGARAEDELRIAWGAVVVHAKGANRDVPAPQLEALGVPEGGYRLHALRGEGGDGVEADR